MSKNGEPCDAENVRECDHVSDRRTTITAADTEELWEWRKHADEHFRGHRSTEPHPGNISDMVRFYVRYGMKRMEEGMLPDFEDQPEERGSGVDLEKAEIRQELEKLRARNAKLKKKLRKAEEAKLEYMARPETDRIATEVGFLIAEIVQTPKTFDEVVTALKKHGVEEYIDKFQQMDEPPQKYDDLILRSVDDVDDLADKVLEELIETNLVTRTPKNNEYYYHATGNDL